MPKKTQNMVVDANGNSVTVTDLNSALAFLNGHLALAVPAKSGYDKYWNTWGPINAEMPLKLNAQGALRNALVFTHVLHVIAAKGGEQAAEATQLLGVLAEYIQTGGAAAKAEVAAQATEKMIREAVLTTIPADKMRQFLADNGVALPQAASEVAEATAEPTGDLDDAGSNAEAVAAEAEGQPA